MEFLRYAPHLNTEKLKVNKFVFGLNYNIRAKVRILMPQTLHDAVHKYFIAEEELNSGGQGRTPSRKTGQTLPHRASQQQTPVRQTSGHRDTPRGPVFSTPCRKTTNQRTLYRAPPATTTHVILNNNNSIDLFCRTDQGLRTLDQQILPLELGAPTLRMDVGLVESPTIREIVLLRRKELLDQQDK
jgi:hypothetical protein